MLQFLALASDEHKQMEDRQVMINSVRCDTMGKASPTSWERSKGVVVGVFDVMGKCQLT